MSVHYRQCPTLVDVDAKSWMLVGCLNKSDIALMTVYVVWMSRACASKEVKAADTSLTSQLRQPVFLVLPWAAQHPSALFNTLWLKRKI